MKKSFVFFAFVLLGIGAKVIAGGDNISYLRTADKVYIGQDLKIGLFNSKIISSDGTINKIPNRDVLAYMDDSRLFEYLPVVCESNEILCYAMMEYISSRSGLRLYRYDCFDGKNTRCYYYIFKDGKFYLQINPVNALTVLPFFGINDIKISGS